MKKLFLPFILFSACSSMELMHFGVHLDTSQLGKTDCLSFDNENCLQLNGHYLVRKTPQKEHSLVKGFSPKDFIKAEFRRVSHEQVLLTLKKQKQDRDHWNIYTSQALSPSIMKKAFPVEKARLVTFKNCTFDITKLLEYEFYVNRETGNVFLNNHKLTCGDETSKIESSFIILKNKEDKINITFKNNSGQLEQWIVDPAEVHSINNEQCLKAFKAQ